MKLADFDFSLPKDLIAQIPLKKRDAARLLVLDRKSGSFEHTSFDKLGEFLRKDDLLVLNNTKVLSARLQGNRLTGGKVDILLLSQLGKGTFRAFIKPSRVKTGEKIIFDSGKLYGVVKSRNEITFNTQDPKSIYGIGRMPLPPYIKRDPGELDDIFYQTVYAKAEGAIASPTAGLHFTQGLLKNLQKTGIDVGYLTLHVGVGTFAPVKAEDIREHRMEPEYFKVPKQTSRLIQIARLDKKRVIAVGTTSLRALEAYSRGRQEGLTDLFIYPGFKFNLADGLLTNFHLPRTTLFMLVCAFAGEKLIKKAYQEAIDKKYRFYSYGDAMLIL
jgi:S-adenosylmethionine:tRNA ribosyltransferase-isomerase